MVADQIEGYEFEKYFDSLSVAGALLDDQLRITKFNSIMSRFLPKPETAVERKDLLIELISEEEHDEFSRFFESSQKSVNRNTWKIFQFKAEKGTYIPLLISIINNLNDSNNSSGFILMGIPITDIYEDNIFDEQLLKNPVEEARFIRYRQIFNNSIIGIMIFDQANRVEEVNRTFLDQLGLIRDEIIGKEIQQIFSGVMLKKVENLIKMVQNNKHGLFKDVVINNNSEGEHFILEISLSKIINNESLDTTMMITEDITEQQDTHAALIRSEKLSLTGRLAASLAHEINNPLQTSIGCLGLVEEMLDEDEKAADLGVYIKMAMEELKRSARIVKKLRDLNRKADPSDRTPVDLQKIIDSVLILTKNRLYDKKVIPVFLYEGEPPIVFGVEDQIKQVILNLVMNAIDAMPEGGYIYFDIDQTQEPEGISVKIRDTGIGMNKDVLAHHFDPFFTTKEEGIGLGLYISKEIIEGHDGYIDVESKEGKGTSFTIWIPGNELGENKE